MKYTRIDLKENKKKKNDLIVLLVSLIILAYIIGTLFSAIVSKKEVDTHSKVENDIVSDKNYIFVQCGVFKNKENADKLKTSLEIYGTSFVTNQGDEFRVLMGIYNSSESTTLCDKLKEAKISSIKVSFNIPESDNCNKEIISILDSDKEIINKFSEKNMKQISTDELKKWIKTLKNVDKESENYYFYENINKYNNNLPLKVQKSNAEDLEKYIYELLNNIKY